MPMLIYEDVGKALEWLCCAFGFTERLRAPGADGNITHAQLAVDEGAIMLGAARPGFRPPHPNEVSHYVHVHVENVDRHFENAKRFGARIVNLPTDHPFGERQYTAEDPEGHWWTFSQSVADVAPEEWGAIPASPADGPK